MSESTEQIRQPLRGVNAALLARYDQPGPRYTSYPTAVEFGPVDNEEYEALLRIADESYEAPLSVYMHLPFCQERCLFCACHVIISPDYSRAVPYLDRVCQEIDLLAERLPRRRQVTQLHLGGGTPTYYKPADLSRMLGHFLKRFTVRADAELAVEIDPRVTTIEHIDMLAEHGFNRLSMGIQDFTPEVQEIIHRTQTFAQTERLMDRARALGFHGLNADLIYGLPLQTPKTFRRTVDQVIALGVDRVALYSFAFVPWMRGHQRALPEETLPDRDTKFALFAIAREQFLEAGYVPIGMDHFARAGDELALARGRHQLRRNFQGYSVVPAPDVIGIGISAIGDIGGTYIQNEKKLSSYEAALDAGRMPVCRGLRRSQDDELRRHVIHELMCNFRVDIGSVEQRFEIDFAEYFAEDLRGLGRHVDEQMVRVGPDSIEVTPLGELFVRNLAMCFDRYWREEHEQQKAPMFSRTV